MIIFPLVLRGEFAVLYIVIHLCHTIAKYKFNELKWKMECWDHKKSVNTSATIASNNNQAIALSKYDEVKVKRSVILYQRSQFERVRYNFWI